MSHQSRLELRLRSTKQPAAVGADPEPARRCRRAAATAPKRPAPPRRRSASPDRRTAFRPRRSSVRLPARAAGAGAQELRQISGGDRPVDTARRNSRSVASRIDSTIGAILSGEGASSRLPPSSAGAKAAGGLGEAGDLRRIVEAVEGACRIAAQHDRVGRVERQHAAGEAVRGPGNRHALKSN